MIDNEGIRAEDARSCLLCGGEGSLLYDGLRDRLFDAHGVWSLMQCSECKLVWLNPQPIGEDLGMLYAHYFTHHKPNDKTRALARLRKAVKESILGSRFGYQMDGSFSRAFGSILGRIGPLEDIVGGRVLYLNGNKMGRLLDVGCGNGHFLDQMKQLGWEVVGVEPDEKAVSVARERLGMNILCGILGEEVKFPERHFDAITMNHVVEHSTDPIGLLKECRRILRPGGKLVVVTPNNMCLGRRIFKDAWLHWDPPRHIFLFSLESLREASRQAGFVSQDLRTTAKSARWMWVTSSLIKQNGFLSGGHPGSKSQWIWIQGTIYQLLESLMSGRRDSGEELVLIATK